MTASVRRVDPNAPNEPAVEAAFRAVPDTLVAEILDGELVTMPRPRPQHAHAAGEVLGELRGPYRHGRGGPGGWIFLAEPELHLGPKPDKLVPDLAGWRRERLPNDVFASDAPGAISVVPDWICEVLSERTEAVDRGRKMRIYRREGLGYLWLLDPRIHTLETYRLEHGRWVHLETWEGYALVRAEPFDALELDLALLWSPGSAG